MKETEVAAEKKKSEQRFRRTEAAVLAHGVVNPVAGARIPQDSAGVAQQKSLDGGGGTQPRRAVNLELARRAGTLQGKNKRCEREPGQNINAGERKDDDLENGRQDDQQPGAEVNLPHG